MVELLSAAGRSFLRAFIASLLILIPGVLSAPNLTEAKALSVAAVIASIAAGIKVLQEFVPLLTTGKLLGAWGSIGDSFVRAFIGTIVVMLPGVLYAPDLGTARSLLVGLIVASVAAGLRALQGAATYGDVPDVTSGT